MVTVLRYALPAVLAGAVLGLVAQQRSGAPRGIVIDYPADGSLFPPEFPAPTFVWRDPDKAGTSWSIEITFADGSAPIRVISKGERMRVGAIDPRCVAPTNKPPALTAEQAAAHTWKPDPAMWAAIKARSVKAPATVTIAGARPESRARIAIRTSADPVGAPIFYRDVPLMPSESEKGVIKPLAASAIPLISWRLRNVGETSSRVLMTGIHSCANCHSLSLDGKTMGMDVDGPQNDKGLYALFSIQPKAVIRREDVIAWSTFKGKLGGKLRVGFMSQVSPDGRYVVTTISDPGEGQPDYQRRLYPRDLILNYYVANFTDYRFLQVFYPTRGVLAWYSRATGKLQTLPGADDPRYVQTDAVWSPDGKYIVFARAEAKDAYPEDGKMALFANDPNETQIKYDLYRIPFNEGRGGQAEPLAGASRNGMSNNFPKLSPDGRWIVFVQCRNGQLMRPDSKLYIVPAEGGAARPLKSNLPVMNSWHSFSPNGRWMVFSSKARSPYTQMYLTHLDSEGNATPAILIDNATAANRAVNIPEFVNIPPEGLLRIDAPVTDYYRAVDIATDLLNRNEYQQALTEWRKAAALGPGEALPENNLGVCLVETGRVEEAIPHYRKALELNPDYPEAHNNLGVALVQAGREAEAIPHYQRALELNPQLANAHNNLGVVFAQQGRTNEAIMHFKRAIDCKPSGEDLEQAHFNLGIALGETGDWVAAIPNFEKAAQLSAGRDALVLDLLSRAYASVGRFGDAATAARRAIKAAKDPTMIEELKSRLAQYEARN